MGAGVLPIAIHNGKVYMLLGKENHFMTNIFGNSCFLSNRNPIRFNIRTRYPEHIRMFLVRVSCRFSTPPSVTRLWSGSLASARRLGDHILVSPALSRTQREDGAQLWS